LLLHLKEPKRDGFLDYRARQLQWLVLRRWLTPRAGARSKLLVP
jgi:hypothetical protein